MQVHDAIVTLTCGYVFSWQSDPTTADEGKHQGDISTSFKLILWADENNCLLLLYIYFWKNRLLTSPKSLLFTLYSIAFMYLVSTIFVCL